jgi:hypothetical protein
MYDALSQEELWTIDERVTPSDVQLFTKDLLAFVPDLKRTTRVIMFSKLGHISSDYTFDQYLDFGKRAVDTHQRQIQGGRVYAPVVIHNEDFKLILSRFSLKIGDE